MDEITLLLKYQLVGDDQLHIKGASRIRVDGRGGLTFYDAQRGKAEVVEIGKLRSFCIQPLHVRPEALVC